MMVSGNDEKIRELQLAEHSLQTLLVQKQNFQVQLMEVEAALKELKGAKEAYRIIGSVMVRADNAALEGDLSSKEETLKLRIKSIDSQESRIRENASSLQKEVLEAMQNDDKGSR
ncbi:prefoldin subunit [Candidatus Woesearchaeota archaeon]|nr:prefoldin subunit [Candidatus Woesearchaeota archaeon]